MAEIDVAVPHERASFAVNPGKGLGFLLLGASLHDVLVRLKAQPTMYPSLEVAYSFQKALSAPVTVSLPKNGLRLKFDGPDQRLRLIEVLDFNKVALTYKGNELVKPGEVSLAGSSRLAAFEPNGPGFRSIYHRLFGPTYPGEYFPPSEQAEQSHGTYILSYPGMAFSFVLPHSAWLGNSDFVSLLSSPAASLAKCLTVFDGESWKHARRNLYTRSCPHPRSLSSVGHAREFDEIDVAVIEGHGLVNMRRRSGDSFYLILGATTAQDLVAELGPPDAIYRKNDRRLSIHKDRASSGVVHPPPLLSGSPGQVGGLSDTDRSSISANTDGSSPEDDDEVIGKGPSTECFYNYFRHGFDVFISYATSQPSPEIDPDFHRDNDMGPPAVPTGDLVATKILLHGNVPGSYAFNRYRRSRWTLDTSTSFQLKRESLDSETPFSKIKTALERVWTKHAENTGMASSIIQKHMVLNRGWGDSPGSSCELLGEWEDAGSESPRKSQHSGNAILANTELHGFPGLLFEVLKNDAVGCLTVY